MSRVVLAMSGGVDSSVAAHLLLEQGHEVIGVFMRHGEEAVEACAIDGQDKTSSPLLPILNQRADHKQGCCSASDAEDGRRVAERLNIPFYALNLEAEFRGIIDYFVDEYSIGRTPNPCVMCNNRIKFGKLFDYADSVGAKFLATGHYAQLAHGDDGPALTRGVDAGKDQSYVLFGIKKKYLSRMLLPVGGYDKPKIREIAGTLGLNVAEKKDSQEICFVTSGKHDQFVRARRGTDSESTAGDIVTTSGKVVGQHPGIEGFTIGQRRGLGVAMGEPYFVVQIKPADKQVVIGPLSDLGCSELTASDTNWLVEPPQGSFRCLAQIRYNSSAWPAEAEVIEDGRLRVKFDEPQNGVAPGQAVVCYDDDRVLGGGWID
ncbi:tRNA 2-thiouridine(34) synthase MnmA [Mariniblastus fucicola]|uniref:tRNA-specific 2-thiouridylase MnmA n=1 Tax=Mariniblastus fucicola TaxID=980251 RepID=A0A5B9PBK9_9BACT|nr:tRNA 2-thiouridine(34) synthase MnmA [Mariniblastus fucicola]QEG20531.1 tRNA-specific 2-thiouridylase MnmA [Mariniblastus fucicola]